MKNNVLPWVVSAAFVLWIFFVLASFFAVQKPFTVENFAAVSNVLLDLLVAGWLALVGLGLGLWILRWLPADLWLIERIVLGAGLGLGFLGLLIFGLGLAGLFQPLTAYLITVILSVAAFPQWRQLGRQLRHWRPANQPDKWIAFYLLATAGLAFLVALTPPIDWDGLFYHLTGPKFYLQAGGVIGGVDVPHFNFPSLMEMLFAWAMLLRGDIAAKLLHAVFGLLLAGLVYLVTRRLLGQKGAWPAALILASMPMLGTLAGWAYNDLALAFYQLAAVYAIINYQLPVTNHQYSPRFALGRHSLLILSGVFAGLAMGLKYTAFVTPLVVIGFILWRGIRSATIREEDVTHQASRPTSHVPRPTSHALRTTLTHLLLFSVAALLTASPWYLKNWAFTGNPVYPFLHTLFDGQFWDGFRAGWYASAGTGIGWRPSTLLALPWLLTLGVRDANYWDGRTGPLLLLFLPLILLCSLRITYYATRNTSRSSPSPAFNLLLVYALAHFLFWTLGVIWSRSLWQSRLLLPGLVGLVPLAGWAWVNLPRFDLPRFSVSRFANIAVGLALALGLVDTALLTLKIDPLPYLVGLESRDEYLTRRLGAHYAAMQQINSELPAGAKVVFLWEPRSYYCRRDCRPDSILDEFPHLVYQFGSAAAIAHQWRQAGVSHVLIHRAGLEFMLNEQPETIDRAVLSKLENEYLEPVFDVAGAYQVYALDAN